MKPITIYAEGDNFKQDAVEAIAESRQEQK